MKIKSYLISLALFTLSANSYSTPQTTFDTTMQQVVDEYYKSHKEKEQFSAIGASVLIPKDKQIDANDIKTYVAGTQDFSANAKPITANNLWEIGSITKSFVSVLLLQLQAEGKLTLDDTLGKWLPQYPQWSNVSLRQLLTMTSGIPNYSDDPVFLKKMYGDLTKVWSNKELLEYAHPDQPIKLNKNNLFDYSNSNYILAALVIEAVTKDSFEHQLQQRIIDKDNYLKNTYYPAGPNADAVKKAISPREIHGYYFDQASKKNVDIFNNDLSWAGAAGAIVADTADVIRWVQTLYHGLDIEATHRENAIAELEAVVSMKTGKRIANVTADDIKGFGLGVGAYYDKELKQPFWFYLGSTLGFRVMYLWQPCNDVTTVVALNSKAAEGDDNSKMGNDIASVNLKLYKEILRLNPDLQCKTL